MAISEKIVNTIHSDINYVAPQWWYDLINRILYQNTSIGLLVLKKEVELMNQWLEAANWQARVEYTGVDVYFVFNSEEERTMFFLKEVF